MNEIIEVFLLIVLRLGIPLLITYLFGRYLKHLDARWREEGLEQMEKTRQALGDRPAVRCWEIRGCTPETRSNCPAYLGAAPCWEVFRSNGSLHQKCSGCEVVKRALTPVGI